MARKGCKIIGINLLDFSIGRTICPPFLLFLPEIIIDKLYMRCKAFNIIFILAVILCGVTTNNLSAQSPYDVDNTNGKYVDMSKPILITMKFEETDPNEVLQIRWSRQNYRIRLSDRSVRLRKLCANVQDSLQWQKD